MLQSKGKAAERALDTLLRDTPDRMLHILTDGGFETALEMLRNADAPDPAWVRSRVRNLRLKSGCAAAELRALAQELQDGLAAWRGAGGSDPVRENQAELVLSQLAGKAAEMEQMRTRLSALIHQTEQAEEAAESLDRRQALQRFKEYRREAEE